MQYRYGMRLRGFSPGCQPMSGLDHAEDDATGRYYNILVYNRKLTEEEVRDYELDYLEKEHKKMARSEALKKAQERYNQATLKIYLRLHRVSDANMVERITDSGMTPQEYLRALIRADIDGRVDWSKDSGSEKEE